MSTLRPVWLSSQLSTARKIIRYSRSTINACFLLSHKWWVPLDFSHMNLDGTYHSCERREYAFMILREYKIFPLMLTKFSSILAFSKYHDGLDSMRLRLLQLPHLFLNLIFYFFYHIEKALSYHLCRLLNSLWNWTLVIQFWKL